MSDKVAVKKQDKEELKAIGMQMGYLDEQMQLGTIDLYLEQLSFVIQKTREELVMKKATMQLSWSDGGDFPCNYSDISGGEDECKFNF